MSRHRTLAAALLSGALLTAASGLAGCGVLGAAGDTPHLTFAQSGSPLVAPRVEWERDLDYDLVGLGLITPDQIPVRRR